MKVRKIFGKVFCNLTHLDSCLMCGKYYQVGIFKAFSRFGKLISSLSTHLHGTANHTVFRTRFSLSFDYVFKFVIACTDNKYFVLQ